MSRTGGKDKRNKKDKRDKMIITAVAISINIFLIFSILYIGLNVHLSNNVSGYDVNRIEVNPNDYEDIIYDNYNDSASAANSQLDDMTYGNIQTLDFEDEDFSGKLILDYERGNILYWSLSDTNLTIYLMAYTNEIIYYHYWGYSYGGLDQEEIHTQGVLIASQFYSLPSDRQGPSIVFKDNQEIRYYDNETTGEISNETFDWWYLTYSRYKNGIETEDFIRIVLFPNGYLNIYSKVWYMSLSGLSTNYIVTQQQAEATALAHAGVNSSIDVSQKLIIRPNNYWIGNWTFGCDPICAWSIKVIDGEDNYRTYHIDGNTNIIIGGDFVYNS